MRACVRVCVEEGEDRFVCVRHLLNCDQATRFLYRREPDRVQTAGLLLY